MGTIDSHKWSSFSKYIVSFIGFLLSKLQNYVLNLKFSIAHINVVATAGIFDWQNVANLRWRNLLSKGGNDHFMHCMSCEKQNSVGNVSNIGKAVNLNESWVIQIWLSDKYGNVLTIDEK